MQFRRQRADDVDPGLIHKLADRQYAEFGVAMRDEIVDPFPGGRRGQLGLRLQLRGEAELIDKLRHVDAVGTAARRVGVGNRFGADERFLERVDRGDVGLHRTLLHPHPNRHTRHRRGGTADELSLSDELVGPRLVQDRHVDLLVCGYLLLHLAGCRIFDFQLVARGLLEGRRQLL